MIYGTENGTNGCHLAVFSVDVAFAHHTVDPTTLHLYRSAGAIGYASKNYLKWLLAIRSTLGVYVDRL